MRAHDSRAAVTALIFRYAELIDLGDLDGLSRLFEHASYRSEHGGEYRGATAVLEILRRVVVLYDGTPRTKHVTTNVSVEVEDDRDSATARSYYTVLQATAQLPLQPIIAGRYHDRFACVDGVWRFADRLIFIDLVGDLSQHLKGFS